MYEALKELLDRLPGASKGALKAETHHPSKHWVRRNGIAIRATKRYFDGRQKARKSRR